jgi:hypothetical protein
VAACSTTSPDVVQRGDAQRLSQVQDATVPTPLWLPSTVTGRTDSTVPSCTCDRRWASPRWITSGLDVAQAVSDATSSASTSFFMDEFSCSPIQRNDAPGR